MRKVELYTGEKTYMFPSGGLATREAVLKQFSAILNFPTYVVTDPRGQMMYEVVNLSVGRDRFGIDDSLSDEEALVKIEEIINTPRETPVVDDTPTAEERIAAALEAQVMLGLPDETV